MKRPHLQLVILTLIGASSFVACTGSKGYAGAGMSGGTASDNSNANAANQNYTNQSYNQSATTQTTNFVAPSSNSASSAPQLVCRMISALANKGNGNAQVDCNNDEVMTSCMTTNVPSGSAHCFNNAVPQGSNYGERPSGRTCLAYCNSAPNSTVQWMVTAICCKIQ